MHSLGINKVIILPRQSPRQVFLVMAGWCVHSRAPHQLGTVLSACSDPGVIMLQVGGDTHKVTPDSG